MACKNCSNLGRLETTYALWEEELRTAPHKTEITDAKLRRLKQKINAIYKAAHKVAELETEAQNYVDNI